MNVEQAAEELKKGKTIREIGITTGWFALFGNTVCFSCPGEYPCCHYDTTLEEFLVECQGYVFEIDERF